MKILSQLTHTNASKLQVLQIGMGWSDGQVGHGGDRYFTGLVRALHHQEIPTSSFYVGQSNEGAESPRLATAVAGSDDLLWRRRSAMRQAVNRHLRRHPDSIMATHFAAYAVATRQTVPHIVHFHGPWADESAVEGGKRLAVLVKRELERRVYRSADRCITLSTAFADLLASRYGVDKNCIRVVPGGIAPEDWDARLNRREAREHLGWPTDRPIVLCVRRLARRMGIENLISAVSQLKLKHPDLLVFIGGSGPLREELAARIKTEGLENHVRLLGFVPEEDLPLAYRAADLSIVPTQALEGFGLIVLESLAAGTPTLVTPVGGLPEVIEGFAAQLILESASVDAIANGLDAALSGDLPLPSSEDCRQYVRENFAWPIIAQKVLEVYEEARR